MIFPILLGAYAVGGVVTTIKEKKEEKEAFARVAPGGVIIPQTPIQKVAGFLLWPLFYIRIQK